MNDTSTTVQRGFSVLDHRLGRFSKLLWPYSLVTLAGLFVIVTVLDGYSTQIALSLNEAAYERNPLARWFITSFGLRGLVLWDLIRIVEYVVLYGGLALLLSRLGLPGIGRFAFVGVTHIYLLAGLGVIVQNYMVAFA